ncbi:MAG: acylneuraminate cytidylyltransferase family protein, partial [Bdellovibrionota bacterium]
MSEILCFIPARGGSKRFKRKNLAPLRNRPVISYAIDAARNSGIFHRIVVSSEDREIREVADRMGATVDERPESLADDGSTVDQTLHEFLLRDSGPEKVICCVYPTAVLLKPEDLVTAAAKFHASSANSMMAVARYNLHPWQAQFVKSDGT